MKLWLFIYLAISIGACKSAADTTIKESASNEEDDQEEFDDIDTEKDLANPFSELDSVPGKMILSGTFMQEYDDDYYNVGFTIFQSENTAYFVHRILNEIVIDLATGISKPQAVSDNDPEAIPLKIEQGPDGITYKSVLNAWQDTWVKTNKEGKILSVSLLKSVSRLVQDPKLSLKDYTYPGQKARIVVDTDI